MQQDKLEMPTASPASHPARKRNAHSEKSLVEQVLTFTGSRPEFATLFLTAAFSSKLLQSGIIFTWNGGDRPPTLEGSLPLVTAGKLPLWMTPILDHLKKNNQPTTIIRIFPPVAKAVSSASRGELLVPLAPAENVFAAFEMADIHPRAVAALLHNLSFFSSLWRFRQPRLDNDPTGILAPVMDILAVVNQATRFQPFAMSLCNELASHFDCAWVSLGFAKGRQVCLTAMSNAGKIDRETPLARAVEGAMEECLDQGVETIHPEPRGFAGVTWAAAELSQRFGFGNVVTIPLHYGNKPFAALTLERAQGKAPGQRELKQMRLIAELSAPRLMNLRIHDRWFGARFGEWLAKKAAWAVQPTHTLPKLAALVCLTLAGYLTVATGEYRVDAAFVTQPVEQRVIAAPFAGFVESAYVRPGELLVTGETLMMELEASETRSLLAMRRAEQRGHEKDASIARRDNKIAESQAAEAKAAEAAAECGLLEDRIRLARIYAPLDGVVLSGDWSRKPGAPVKAGDTLFEVGPLTDMEADLYIPEEDISDIRVGQGGELSAAGRPGEKIRFEVVRITPSAELVKQKNIFRVQVRLAAPPPWLRPGIEGVAKVEVGERLLVDIWTRRALNWGRMKLWM